MREYRLRNHIPLGAPGTREPFLGDEPPLRVSLGFTPRWYRDRLGIDFGERWHEDPLYRYRTLIAQMEEIGCMGYIDTGISSDLARVKALFPDARRAVLYGPGDAETRSLPEIENDIARVAREYAPCDIVLADVETTMPDGRVREFLALAREYRKTVVTA